jgi:hypothetical protein
VLADLVDDDDVLVAAPRRRPGLEDEPGRELRSWPLQSPKAVESASGITVSAQRDFLLIMITIKCPID